MRLNKKDIGLVAKVSDKKIDINYQGVNNLDVLSIAESLIGLAIKNELNTGNTPEAMNMMLIGVMRKIQLDNNLDHKLRKDVE